MDLKPHIIKSIQTAIAAGKAINAVYHSEDFGVEYKSDTSPLTVADQKSHEIIMKMLQDGDIPILSEEGLDMPYAQRKDWVRFWVVDPLDGTKEFIKRNGEFTVNIALIQDGRPVMGTIFVPDRDTLYFAAQGFGAYKLEDGPFDELQYAPADSDEQARILLGQIVEQSTPLPIEHPRRVALTIVGSRSHKTAELQAYVEEKRKAVGDVEFISAGSSLKICLVAEGRADIYPRLGPTMEWDTAAGQAIAEAAGATVCEYGTLNPLMYNKEDLHNPWFIVQR
ncbi:MAG: 3'(2'),5'-bisphosphate nucleotidase CysQ [Deltaproteobacteria bacterium]|jgi:3'(2'), 5'-bisphosphate nucleotidase|nr:3'(2'),5'-bisphosphate nucleotidase CysQ [Deltaproteobacteria bacterium]